MELVRCVKAFAAAEQLMNEEFDYASALKLYMLRKSLKDAVDFFNTRELTLINELASRDEDGKIVTKEDGRVVFPNSEVAHDFVMRRAELGATDYSFADPIEIKAPPKIRPAQLRDLDGFVIFTE